MASRRGTPSSGQAQGAAGERADRFDAPLIVRLKEPAGSTEHRNVRLRVDYFNGTVGARTERVLACLFADSVGKRLSTNDKQSLERQLRHWLARNKSALRIGSTVSKSANDDQGEFLFAFQQADPLEREVDVPPPRPLPEHTPTTAPAAPPPLAGRLNRFKK